MSAGHRWLMGISGALWVILGILFFTQPIATALVAGATVVIFAAIALIVAGIFEIAAWVSAPKEFRRGWTLATGILTIMLGILILWQPVAAGLSIPYILAFVLIFRGVVEIAGSLTAKRMGIKRWWTVLISGLFALLVAFWIFASPLSMTVIYFGVFFLMYGALEIVAAFTSKEPAEVSIL